MEGKQQKLSSTRQQEKARFHLEQGRRGMFRKEVTEKGDLAASLLYVPKGPAQEIQRVEAGDRWGDISFCSIGL